MKVGDLSNAYVVSVGPGWSLRDAARHMVEHRVGSAVVLNEDNLVGILTERDVLRAVAEGMGLDETRVEKLMTRDVVTIEPDWEIYEAAAEMAAHHFRHLIVADGSGVLGVLSIRDLLLAGQRVPLADGHWAVLRDPLTFTVRERRRLQRQLISLGGGRPDELDLGELVALLVATWSLDLPLPADAPDVLDRVPPADLAALGAAVLSELPELQRAVHPAPGWRRRR
jgi:CBS domain-containing protein